jgi:methionine synthase II (cobalamin-independent)
VFLGVVPAVAPTAAPTVRAAADRALRLLDMLGHDPEDVGDQLVLTPACGLAGATSSYAGTVLRLLAEAARELP